MSTHTHERATRRHKRDEYWGRLGIWFGLLLVGFSVMGGKLTPERVGTAIGVMVCLWVTAVVLMWLTVVILRWML